MAKWIIAIVVVVAGISFLMWYNHSNPPSVSVSPTVTATADGSVSPSPSSSATPSSSPTITPKTSATPVSKATVTYTDSGYSPSSVTIAVGGSVTFINKSSRNMWTASDPHPIHNGYPEDGGCINSDFDECKAEPNGASYTFTFTKAGTWGYHNHSRSSDKGVVIVK